MLRMCLGFLRELTRSRAMIVIHAGVLVALLLVAAVARGEVASQNDMNRVCANWLTAMVHEQGNWAGSFAPSVKATQVLYTGDTALGILYAIQPTGFVMVPLLKALPPIWAYSDQSDLDIRDTVGMVQLLRDMLRSRFVTYVAKYGSLTAALPKTNAISGESMWEVYTLDDPSFASSLNAMQPLAQGDILLNGNNWSQGSPWNLKCPVIQGCSSTPVGCVATSASQIMRYWQWPPQGEGSHCYWWYGNGAGIQLCAQFNHPYDWANMPLKGGGTWTQAEKDAMSQLCSDVGVAFNMDYGCSGSGAYIDNDVWTNYFWYDSSTSLAHRSSYDADGWFDLIVSEIEANRPMQFAIQPLAHALVCDGWRTFSGNQIHMNYGWGGPTTGWFFIDNIYGSNPTDEYMRIGIRPAANAFHVKLTVHSASPDSGVAVSVTPSDTTGLGNGTTPFTRDYSPDRVVTLGAPTTAGGNSFAKWQRDGMDYPGGVNVTVTADMNHTMTAVYLSCAEAVGQPWITPRSPECVNGTYSVTWNRLAGAASYEIRQNGGTWVSTGSDTAKSFSQSAAGAYIYEVHAVSACGQGVASTPVTVAVESNAPLAPPGQPWADPSVPMCLNTPYTVNWNPVSGADGYQLRENGGGWQNLGAVTTWFGEKSVAGVYSYEIRAINACGSSNPSPSVAVTITAGGALPTTPGQPSFLPVGPVCVNKQFTVRWSPVQGAEYYEIRENGGAWHSSGAITMWSVVKSMSGTFYYEVRAANGCGSSAPSPADTMTVGTCNNLIVYSLNPTDGVPIVVSAPDQDGLGNGPTPFSRMYCTGTSLTLEAPADFNGSAFQKWQQDNLDYSTQPAITFNLAASHVMTAIFNPCTCPKQGDMDGNGFVDVQDVLAAIRVAFVNGSDVKDPGCPETRADVNNSGVVDVNDVLYIIKTAFTNGPNPVNPCGP